ncbi:MAG: ribonuclease E/G, partial [Pseudanabaenales cyanobacterium]|nr:ribonuclease E/G [Pseudanabaenales cyanobacterium]
ISVEMTPDEQRIYAMMGISPLVLAHQAVKDPKTAIMNVVLPGQTPPALPTVPSNPEPETSSALSAENSAAAVAEESAETRLATPADKPLNSESADGLETNGGVTRRRRRRRSSAAELETAGALGSDL